MKTPMEMLLKILLSGERVFHDGYTHAMADDGSLCIVMTKDDGEEIYCDCHCSLAGLKQMAEEIGKEELWLKLCAMQLKKDKR